MLPQTVKHIPDLPFNRRVHAARPTPKALQLRLARLEDLPALMELVDQSIHVLSAQDYSPQLLAGVLEYIFGADTEILIKDGAYYVAEIDNQIVGGGGWSRRKTIHPNEQAKAALEENNFLDPAKEPAKIRALYVHPDWARRRIGSRLLQKCEAAAKKAGFKQLELATTLTGIPLYAIYGYKAFGRVDIELPDGLSLPLLKMAKSLV